MPGPTLIFGELDQLRHHLVVGLLLDEQTRSGAAALAVVEVNRRGRSDRRGLEVGVVEDDVGRLAAELERDALQVAGRRPHDLVTDFGRAGERDLVDVGMRGDRRACGLAESGDDVDHAGRDAGFLEQLAEAQRRERRLLGRLEDDGIAAGQGGAELPGGHQQREVPGDDLPDDADRLAQRVVQHAHARRRDRDGLAFDLGRPTGVVAEVVDDERNVGDARDADRLAIVERLELRELLGVGLDQVGQLPDRAAALGRGHAAPRTALEGAPRRAHGAIDVFLLTGCHLGKRLFGGGIVGGERLAGGRLGPLAIDEHAASTAADELRHAAVDTGVACLDTWMRHFGTSPARRGRACCDAERFRCTPGSSGVSIALHSQWRRALAPWRRSRSV
jgi:ParB family chromosome partitioning protein